MHTLLLAFATVSCLLLSGCTPVVDAEFHSASGEPIVVTNIAQPLFQASIPPGRSAPVDIFMSRSGHPVGFSIATGRRVWLYRHHIRFLASVSPEYWERGPFESKRLHVSVDSHGSIYLLSSSGTPTSQPVANRWR
jgi:hypothetical protein